MAVMVVVMSGLYLIAGGAQNLLLAAGALLPFTTQSDTETEATENPDTENADTENPDTEETNTENRDMQPEQNTEMDSSTDEQSEENEAVPSADSIGSEEENTDPQEAEAAVSEETQNVDENTEADTEEADAQAEPDRDETAGDELLYNPEELETVEEAYFGAPVYSYADSENVPYTLETLNESGTKKFYVQTYNDVLALQELSKYSSLEGYIFEFAKLDNTTNVWNLNEIGFTGIGTAEYPFRGTVQEYYDSGTSFNLNSPLFQYLGSGASIINFTIQLDNATSGLANYFIATDEKPVVCRNVTLRGTVTNLNTAASEGVTGGVAGALYGTVINQRAGGETYELVIDGSGLNLTGITVNARIAGGYVGDVQGNIYVQVYNTSNVADTVYNSNGTGVAIGGLVGRLSAGSSLEVMGNLSSANHVGYSGNVYSNNTSQAVGGLIGLCQNATVISEQKVSRNNNVFVASGTAAGFIGRAVDSAVTIRNFQLNSMVKSGIGRYGVAQYAGGVVGIYETTGASSTAKMEISHIGIKGDQQIAAGYNGTYNTTTIGSITNTAGGVVAYIHGDNVTISDISCDGFDGDYQFLPCLGCDGYDAGKQTSRTATGFVGGIAGRASGKNILVSDVKVNYDTTHRIGGTYVGGIFGVVETQSKLRLTDITVSSFIIYYQNNDNYRPNYVGGLFSWVDKGCIISLGAKDSEKGWDGVIDVSGIGYQYGTAAISGFRYKTNRGYVAGYQNESLIYLEEDATYQRNATADDITNAVWTNACYNNYLNYTLDDVGTYGGLYKNVRDNTDNSLVIDYSRAYGREVTGTVSRNGEGAYELSDEADALRLAIALNTFNVSGGTALRFAADCFQSGETANTLLQADYVITGDLDLETAGIYSLSRNDSISYPFRGTLIGQKADGTKPDVRLYIVSQQSMAGLFPAVKDASFENFALDGVLYYPSNFGGLAYRADGSISVIKVDNQMKMRTGCYVYGTGYSYYYGGYFGYYELGNGIFTCRNCMVAPEIENIRAQQVVGGLTGSIITNGNAWTTGSAYNIVIDTVTVGTRLKVGNYFMQNLSSYLFHARMSGLIASINRSVWHNQHDWAGVESRVTTNTYAGVHLTDITVDGAEIDAQNISNSSTTNLRVTGGFLGYEWDNAEVIADGAVGIRVTGNSEIRSRGHVGGLFTTFSGKLDFQSPVKLESMTMYSVDQNQNFCGLLVGDARYAMITLTADKYYIDSSNVTVQRYTNFDEIAGVNRKITSNWVNSNNGYYGTIMDADNSFGGIVNILLPDFGNMAESDYQSYQNRVVTTSNPYTRYYYNLFTSDYQPIAVSGTTATLDSPEDLMLWHLYEYTRTSNYLQRFFLPYFSTGSAMDYNGTWKLQGTFDMKGYSFYPTLISGGTYTGEIDTIIRLYAEEIEAAENAHAQDCDKRTPQAARQHYLMHAGLFHNASGFKVENLTFQGTAANLGSNSGMLSSRNVSGTVTISGIVFDGARLANYGSDCSGLMLGNVQGGNLSSTSPVATVTITGVKTRNYTGDKKAAGALIGKVGSENATNFKVYLSNMKVDSDRVEPGTSATDKTGKVFRFASFICEYYYSSVTNENTNKLVLYTFTKADATAGNVTYGEEISRGVEYNDQVRDAALIEKINNAGAETGKEAYIPYVHNKDQKSRQIFVNPQNGNLTVGCGTYEDPYQISTSRQLMNLYLYMTDSGAYVNIFQGNGNDATKWTVNLVGNGNVDELGNPRCNVDGTLITEHTSAAYGAANFPTREQLRTAYYQIVADIDLTTYSDLNDYIINCDFVGIGSTRYPFAGVMVGKGNPTITMPKTTNTAANYALFQYIKGAVIKDLHLAQETDGGVKQTIQLGSSGSGACVAAEVLGGDNIIDNVSVDMTLTITYSSGTTVKTGAYAGYVRRGSLILRNLKEADFANYSVRVSGTGSPDTAIETAFAGNSYLYKRNCKLIGWVEDGYVLYDGTAFGTTDAVIETLGTGSIPLSYSFPIVNGGYLSTGISDAEKGRIKVEGDSVGGFTLNIYNVQQLEVAALALNSDAFSIYDSGAVNTSHTNAYDYTAICRKAAYSNVGCGYASANSGSVSDFNEATKNDDGQKHYPYIYAKYMDFSGIADGSYKTTLHQSGSRYLSYLNWTPSNNSTYGSINNGNIKTTYKLDNSDPAYVYNLAQFGRSFRGFGALYQTTYSVFKADFDGRMDPDKDSAKVQLDMVRDWDANIRTAGMFNNLQTIRPDTDTSARTGGGFTIQNLNICNSRVMDNNSSSACGAIAGYVKGIWNFDNVVLSRDTDRDAAAYDISGSSAAYVGGLVGCINYYSTGATQNKQQRITFTNSGVKGTDDSTKNVAMYTSSYVGGLAGYVQGYDGTYGWTTHTYYGDIIFTDCYVSHAGIRSTANDAGGFIGRVGYTYSNYQNNGSSSCGTVTITKTSESTTDTVSDTTVTVSSTGTYRSAGGLVGIFVGIAGSTTSSLTVDGPVLNKVQVKSTTGDHTNDSYVNYGIGGIVGGAWTNRIDVQNIEIKDSKIGDETDDTSNTYVRLPAAGVVGECYINNLVVKNVTLAETRIASQNVVGGVIANSQVVSGFNVEKITIKDSELWSKSNASGGVVGANVTNGRTVSTMNIAQVTLENSKLYAGYTNSGGTIMVSGTGESASAGGVIGRLTVQVPSLNISKVVAGKGTELVGYRAGAVAGNLQANTGLTMKDYISVGFHVSGTDAAGNDLIEADKTDAQKNDTSAVSIFGRDRCGALIGSNTTAYDQNCSAAVQVYNTRVGTQSTTTTAMAAGLEGYFSGHTAKYDSVEIKNSLFAVAMGSLGSTANVAAGGLIGNLGGGTVYVYDPKLGDNSIGYVQGGMSSLSVLEGLTTASEDLKLIHNSSSWDLTKWDAVTGGLSESNVAQYCRGIGNLVGFRSSGNGVMYVLRPEITYADDFAGNRPAIDVGSNATGTTAAYDTEYGYGYPYDYRPYIHIIYFQPSGDAAGQAATYIDAGLLTQLSSSSDGEDEYLFSRLNAIGDGYMDAANTGKDFLADYNLNVALNQMKIAQAGSTDTYFNLLDNSHEKKYIKTLKPELAPSGIQCLYADGVGAQYLLESMVDLLTNVGGGDVPDAVMKVTAVSAKIDNTGKIVANPGKQSSIEVIDASRNDNSIKNVQFRSFSADELTQDGELTITLLVYNYGWTGADGVRKSETLYVPVFVVERISLYNDMHIMEGEQYSLERAHNAAVSYQGEVTVAHDSTYTLYSEFAYSSGRNKESYQDFVVQKKLEFFQQQPDYTWAKADIPKGLHLTLVDVSTGKPYYYTVGDTQKEVNFSDFLDENGVAYVCRKVGDASSDGAMKTQQGYVYNGVQVGEEEVFGLEQFYIYVEPSEDTTILNSIFKWTVSIDETNEGVKNFLDRSEDNNSIDITWMPGLEISFDYRDVDGTKDEYGKFPLIETTADVAEGSAINQETRITIDAAINITADNEYWNQKAAASGRFIDSQNNGKYLDVAIYLIDRTTREYVTLPPGTYLRLIHEDGTSQGRPTTGQSITYAYQEWGNTFPLGALQENVQNWNQQVDSGTPDEPYLNTFRLEMDFSTAQIDNYVGNDYDLYMELRRTSDPNYPLEGSKLDDYSEIVKSYGNKELATALEVKDENIRSLGINTYKQNAISHEIPFITKLDFANMIYNDADLETCAQSDYLITYRIKKKLQTKDSNGVPMTDSSGNPVYEYQSVGTGTDDTISALQIQDEFVLQLADGETGELVFKADYGANGEEPVYQMIRRFTKNQIKNGTDGTEKLLTWDMKLIIHAASIQNFDLSNYMVEVTVLPFDPALTASADTTTLTVQGMDRTIPKKDETEDSLKDFYIFTSGKIKTDL